MKQLDYGKGYRYAHDEPEAVAAMDCLPPALRGRQYYRPTTRGFEKELGRRLSAWRRVKSQRMAERDTPGAGREDPSGTT
jgi:putative ATPase